MRHCTLVLKMQKMFFHLEIVVGRFLKLLILDQNSVQRIGKAVADVCQCEEASVLVENEDEYSEVASSRPSSAGLQQPLAPQGSGEDDPGSFKALLNR